MKPLFQALREACNKVAEGFGDANHFHVDLHSGEFLHFGDWRGKCTYHGLNYGGYPTTFSVNYELSPSGTKLVVMAQGASLEYIDMNPYWLEQKARLETEYRNSQARIVSDACYKNWKAEQERQMEEGLERHDEESMDRRKP